MTPVQKCLDILAITRLLFLRDAIQRQTMNLTSRGTFLNQRGLVCRIAKSCYCQILNLSNEASCKQKSFFNIKVGKNCIVNFKGYKWINIRLSFTHRLWTSVSMQFQLQSSFPSKNNPMSTHLPGPQKNVFSGQTV